MVTTITLGGRTFAVTPNGPAEYLELLPAVWRVCGTDRPTPEQVGAALRTLDGGRAAIAVTLRKADPSVTPEWVAEHVPDLPTCHAVYADLSAAFARPI